MIGKLITLVIGAVFVGALAGTAVTAILAVNTSTWGNAATLWLVVPIVVVAALIMAIIKESGIEL